MGARKGWVEPLRGEEGSEHQVGGQVSGKHSQQTRDKAVVKKQGGNTERKEYGATRECARRSSVDKILVFNFPLVGNAKPPLVPGQ